MKAYFLLLIILCLFGCKEQQTSMHLYLFSQELSKEENLIVQSLIAYADSLQEKSRAMSGSTVLRDFAALGNKELEAVPIYHFDIDKFYEDPKPENILSSLFRPDSLRVFVVRDKGNILYAVVAEKYKEKWYPYSILDDAKEMYEKAARLMDGGKNTDLQIIKFEGIYYRTYLKEGKRVYMGVNGVEMTPEQMCSELVSLISAMKAAQAEGTELYL